MASWQDFKDFLTSEGINFEDKGDRVLTGFQFEDGRSQSILILRQGTDELEMAAFTSPVGPADPTKLPALCEAAFVTPFGIVSTEDLYILQGSMPLKDLDGSEVHFFLGAISTQADELEKQIFGVDHF